jgi:ABC-type multidrug transport system ATPase subunit
LLFAFLTDSEIILLDEPTSNLDATGKQWYRSLVTNYQMNRLLIVASNHLPEEYDFCKEVIELS